jgi:broad specificity phosphatase PhoE
MNVTIKLVRHGQSEGNANGYDNAGIGDHSICLTEKGKQQAFEAGKIIGKDFISEALIYCSPYTRARETFCEILNGADARVIKGLYEEPRLREVEHGYVNMTEEQLDAARAIHGPFYYRMNGGESPADCYDRVSTFLESMGRQIKRKGADKVLIIAHGLTIRCFVMRFLHLTVSQFEKMKNPWNGDIITIARRDRLNVPVFTSGQWGVEGVKLK